jgi:HlyD family secretion protein
MNSAIKRAVLLYAVALVACNDDDAPDAFGNIEATEVVVAPETSGQLLWFSPQEGMPLGVGTLVGVIDTTQIALEVAQVGAQRVSTGSRANEVSQYVDVLEVQRDIARRTYERTARLFAQQAATAQQLDQSERDYRMLVEQVEAALAQRQTVTSDMVGSDVRVAQARERIKRSRIVNPQAGVVLTTYAKSGEFVQVGQPLYKIADLRVVTMRAYITETQLARVRVGQQARVSIDSGADERRVLPGIVTWISPEAEFTPTPVETREERADLVYAVKISLQNPGGLLKIGMPADVRFVSTEPTPRRAQLP